MTELTEQQSSLLNWYNELNDVERVAVDYWLGTGSTRLIVAFEQFSEYLRRYRYVPFVERPLEPVEQRLPTDG